MGVLFCFGGRAVTRVVTSQFEIPRAPPPRKYPGHKNRTSNACYHSFSIFTVIFPLFWCRHLAQSLWWWYSRDFAVMHNLILVFSKHFQNSEQKFQTNPLLFRSNGSGLISDVNWGQGSSENLKRKEEKINYAATNLRSKYMYMSFAWQNFL